MILCIIKISLKLNQRFKNFNNLETKTQTKDYTFRSKKCKQFIQVQKYPYHD